MWLRSSLQARAVNDGMGKYIATEVVKKIIKAGKNVLNSKVLVMGATFKENVSDIRNSKVADVVNELKSYGVLVEIIDPYASSEEFEKEYGFGISSKPGNDYRMPLLLPLPIKSIPIFPRNYFISHCADKGIVMDVKGIYRNKIKEAYLYEPYKSYILDMHDMIKRNLPSSE